MRTNKRVVKLLRSVRRGGGLRGVRGVGLLLVASCGIDDRSTGVPEGELAPPGSAGAAPPEMAAPPAEGASGAAGLGEPPVELGSGGGPAASPGASATGAALADAGSGVAAPTPPAPPTPLGPAVCGQQLLVNGSFDEGASGWDETWDARKVLFTADDPLLVAAGVAPQEGSALAWLGGVANGEFGQKYTTRIEQEVVIPSDAIALSVTGQLRVRQPELGLPFPAVDWAVLELLEPDPAGGFQIAWQIETWSDEDASDGWVAFEALNTTEIARLVGRRLLLSAASRPDGNGTLSVWLDALRLEARCP